MANDVGGPTAAPQTETKPKRTLLDLSAGFLKPGSLSHFLLWREGSGLTLGLLTAFFQWGFPLHLRGDWTGLMVFIAILGTVVSAWYPSAQSNALQYAMRDEGSLDPQQINRDHMWSMVPLFFMGAIYLLTAVGIILHFTTDLLDTPDMTWLRDRMIISYPMLFYSFVQYFKVKADLGNNNTVLSQFVQLAGRLRRFDSH